MEVALKPLTGGLAGVIAGDSAICQCGQAEHGLHYRGYEIDELTTHGSFEEVAWLLTRGELPNKRELENYRSKLRSLRDLPTVLKNILEEIPGNADPLDALRSGCSILGNLEPETERHDQMAIADRLIACFPSIVLYWWNFHQNKQRLALSTNDETQAGHILRLLTNKSPDETFRKCLDVALILYAEHEFNASTFTVRTIASTLSDFYSAICGGIGALRGPLHGGANEEALEMIKRFKNPDEAESGVRQMLGRKQLVMGFGHRVYKTADPRSEVIKKWAHKLSFHSQEPQLFDIAKRIEEVMWEEKRLCANLDFYSGLAFYYVGIPIQMFTSIFAISRITGWSAHLMEQRAHNKLIRPISRYTGPGPRSWTPVEQR